MGQFQLKPSFAGGELTPALYGRTDLQKYDVGAAVLENAIVLRYGGVTRRPGFRHVEQTAANKKARLIPFSYNAEQNYVIEFTDKKARIYANGEILKKNNVIVEVTTPYLESELPELKYTQSADMLFLCHPNHHPASLTRTLTGWEYEVLNIENGPFDDPNITDTKMRLVPLMWTNTGEEVKAPFFYDEDDYFVSFASTHTQATATGYYITKDPDIGYSGGTVTPVSDTIFNVGPLKDIWLRCDVLGSGSDYDHFATDLYFCVCFDNDTDTEIGVNASAVYYKNGSGTWIHNDGLDFDSGTDHYYSHENYIGSQGYDGEVDYDDPDHDEPAEWGNPLFSYYSPYVTPAQFTTRIGDYADMTYHNKEYIKLVVHISTSGVWVYHNDNLVYSQEAPQGNAITHIITSPYDSWVSNIIIANFDCSDMTLVGGGGEGDIDVSGFYRGTMAILESSDSTNPVFADDMLEQLVRLGHNVPAAYQKGVPNTSDDLSVRCVPGASVYVESYGFWEGYFEVFKKDDLEEWVSLKKQSGNRSQNYNMTFQNDDDVLRYYKVDSDDFDNSVKGDEDPDQRGYVTIQSFSNDYDGIVRIKEIIDNRHALVEVVKEVASSKWTLDWSLQAWSPRNGYPQAASFFEDRLVFGGSPKHPQTYWASKTGDYLNFGTSYPGKDDDAITGTLASGKMNAIKAIVSFGEMVMLTSGGEYRVGGSGGQNFTPTTQQARAQEYRGITDVPPIIIGGRIIYVQRGGSIIRDLAYSYDVDKYTGDEVSILASHLFDGYEIIGMAYQQAPESVLWCVRSDGVLLGMTYIKEQDVYAWHRHTTQGQFVDVCSIPGEVEDELWVCVKRGDNYYVEQMTSQSDNVYVDAAAVYESATARDYMTGLTWLANETVKVVGDGNRLADTEISAAGRLDVDNEFNRIVTGLGYDTTVTTLPIEMNGQDGTWGSRKKRIQNMCVMFKDTLGGRFGFNGKPLDEIKWRSTEPYGTAVQAYTGKKKVTLPQANYEDTLMLTIKQPDPFPMTILSIIPEILPGG